MKLFSALAGFFFFSNGVDCFNNPQFRSLKATFSKSYTAPNFPIKSCLPSGPERINNVKQNSLLAAASSAEVNGSLVNGVVNGDFNIKLSTCEKARTVTSISTSGTLCTVSCSEGIEGAPFGSFVDYVLDDDGNPVFLFNERSLHTININKNDNGQNLVTLFVQDSSSSMQDVSRCSITGAVEKLEKGVNIDDMDAIRMRYSITHAYADQVMDSSKFHFYRLIPSKIYYVGGFGVQATWVPVEDYTTAAPDILAREATKIVSKLNKEGYDDLLLTASQLLNVEEIENVRVTNVDRLGIDIRVTKRARRNKLVTDEFRVGFRIPVISVEDAKSEIQKVFQEAWERAQGYTWDSDELPGSDVPIVKIAEDSLG